MWCDREEHNHENNGNAGERRDSVVCNNDDSHDDKQLQNRGFGVSKGLRILSFEGFV